MSSTAQAAYTAYGIYKRDISDVPSTTFLQWCDWINKFGYRYFLTIDPERFITTQSYTITASPSSQALPATFKSMQPAGCGLFEIDGSGADTTNQLIVTGFGSSEKGYYITGGNIVFTGIENGTYKMRFIPTITTLDALTDYFSVDTTNSGKEIFSDEYIQYIVAAIDVLYSQWDEDLGMEGLTDARFARLLNEYGNNERRTPGVYNLD